MPEVLGACLGPEVRYLNAAVFLSLSSISQYSKLRGTQSKYLCGLLNGAVGISDYIESNGTAIDE
jgi:hypothetical protein